MKPRVSRKTFRVDFVGVKLTQEQERLFNRAIQKAVLAELAVAQGIGVTSTKRIAKGTKGIVVRRPKKPRG